MSGHFGHDWVSFEYQLGLFCYADLATLTPNPLADSLSFARECIIHFSLNETTRI